MKIEPKTMSHKKTNKGTCELTVISPPTKTVPSHVVSTKSPNVKPPPKSSIISQRTASIICFHVITLNAYSIKIANRATQELKPDVMCTSGESTPSKTQSKIVTANNKSNILGCVLFSPGTATVAISIFRLGLK